MFTRKNNIIKMAFALCACALFTLGANAQTIYDIQYTESANGDSPLMDQVVTTSGVVTAAYDSGYYIQDGDGPWTGIYVFDFDNGPSVSMGDSVTVTATVQEFYTLTELSFVTSFEITGTGTINDPAEITTSQANMEMYEGVLVKVSEANCTNPDAGFGQWTIDDGSGSVFVNDLFYNYTASMNTMYNVTGVLNYSFDEWKIEPRMSSDIEVFIGIENNPTIEWRSFPNPAEDFIMIETSIDQYTITVFTMDGRMVKSENCNSQVSRVNLSELECGMYLVNITSGDASHSAVIEKI